MTPNSTCPLCTLDGEQYAEGAGHVFGHRCRTCGVFNVSGLLLAAIARPPRSRPRLPAFTRERTVRSTEPPLLVSSWANIPDPTPDVIGLEDAEAAFPATVGERLERALQNLSRLSPKPGAWVDLASGRDYPLGYAEDDEAFDFLLSQLDDSGDLELSRDRGAGDTVPPAVRRTAAGWNRVAEIERGLPSVDARQAFSALWFDPSLEDIREHGLKAGVVAAGYGACIISDQEFLGDIHDRILAKIRKSRFMVADFTGQRQNVYYEAGFAEALGIEVIYTCRKDEIGRAHSDLLQSAGAWMRTLAVVRAEDTEAATFEAAFQEVLSRFEALAGEDDIRRHDLIWFVISWALWRRPAAERERRA